MKRHVLFVLRLVVIPLLCGTLVSANTAMHKPFYGTYHNQREKILVKVGSGRSLVRFLWRLKLGYFRRTFLDYGWYLEAYNSFRAKPT